MKKILQITALAILFTTQLFAQYDIENVKITYGTELEDDKAKIVKLFGEANGTIYALALKGKDNYFIKTFGSTEMNLKTNNLIELPELKDRDIEFKEVALLDSKPYIIGSVYHRKDKVYTLVGFELGTDGKVKNEMITLFESKVERNSGKGSFYYKVSPEENSILIMHTAYFNKEDALKYEIKLFDSNLKELFSNIDKVTYDDSKKDYQFMLSDFDVNVFGDVFIVINESYRDAKKKQKVEKFQVFSFINGKNYTKEVIDINFKDKEIINCKMLATNKNTLQLVGFYSSVRDNGKAERDLKGVYNATINLSTNSNDNLVFNEFDYETKVKLIGERRAKKGKDVKPLYNIHSIIEKNDGGLIVLSEYQMVIVGQKQGIGPLGIQPITYITNEIIVTSLKPNGTLDWSNVVAKDQAATITVASLNFFAASGNANFAVGLGLSIPIASMGKGPEYLSAIPIYKDGKLSVIFNDNKKNKGVTDIEKIKSLGNYNNAVPTLIRFDEKGNITRFDPEEVIKNELVIRPGVFYRKNVEELLIYASRKKQDKLGRMFVN